jgi:hypothetical protein
MTLKVGSLIFATDQGLGYLAKAFYDHGILTDVMVVQHGRRPDHKEWYPMFSDTQYLTRIRHPEDIESAKRFCSRMDCMLFFETPFIWELLPFCKERGVKTVLVPMHECMPEDMPSHPDTYLCPSQLDAQWACRHPSVRADYLTIPVDTDLVKWKQRTTATTFVHNAGNGGLLGRNGTAALLQALPMVKSPAHFVIRMQETSIIPNVYMGNSCMTIEYVNGTQPFETLWDTGDVFVFPEKFNGLSLPLQEAYASGMLVMGTNRYPINNWLPNLPLIMPEGYVKTRVARRCIEFDQALLSPKAIAEKVDEWYGKDISTYSLQGKAWGELNSWDTLKPKYVSFLERLCSK